MYKNQTQRNIKEQPYISLQKLGENKLVRGITTLVGGIVGFCLVYQVAKSIDSYIPNEVDAAEISEKLNNTKSIESVLTQEQAETTINHKSKTAQLYNKIVSPYIKDMSDLQQRLRIITLAHRRGIDTTKSKRYSELGYNDYLFRV